MILTIKILESANKKQKNIVLANKTYKQRTIESNQYSHTFILHNKFVLNYKLICFNRSEEHTSELQSPA